MQGENTGCRFLFNGVIRNTEVSGLILDVGLECGLLCCVAVVCSEGSQVGGAVGMGFIKDLLSLVVADWRMSSE